jgi:hypothetical protein
MVFELQKSAVKRLKNLSRAQNCTFHKTIDRRAISEVAGAGLAWPPSLIYMGQATPGREGLTSWRPSPKSLHGAAGMKEPRKSPPRKSPAKSDEKLDEELEESFPASDPPANTTPTTVGGPARPQAKRPTPGKPPRRA